MPATPFEIGAQGLGAAVGLVQAIGGLGKEKRLERKANKLFSQRKAFETPKEIFDILQMTQNDAQTGLSSETQNYLTGQADRGLASTLDAATLLGADPNQLSSTLDSYFQDIFKIGNENELAKMKKFDNLINATSLVAQNEEAEQISRDNLIKDQLQGVAADRQAATQGVQSGLNLALNGIVGLAGTDLYGRPRKKGNPATGTPPKINIYSPAPYSVPPGSEE